MSGLDPQTDGACCEGDGAKFVTVAELQQGRGVVETAVAGEAFLHSDPLCSTPPLNNLSPPPFASLPLSSLPSPPATSLGNSSVHLASGAIPPFSLRGSGSGCESPWQPIHSHKCHVNSNPDLRCPFSFFHLFSKRTKTNKVSKYSSETLPERKKKPQDSVNHLKRGTQGMRLNCVAVSPLLRGSSSDPLSSLPSLCVFLRAVAQRHQLCVARRGRLPPILPKNNSSEWA